MPHFIGVAPLLSEPEIGFQPPYDFGAWGGWGVQLANPPADVVDVLKEDVRWSDPWACGTFADLKAAPLWIVLSPVNDADEDALATVESVYSEVREYPDYLVLALRLAAPGWLGRGSIVVLDPGQPSPSFIEASSWPLQPPWPLPPRRALDGLLPERYAWHRYELIEEALSTAAGLFARLTASDFPAYLGLPMARFAQSYEEFGHAADDRLLKLMIALEGMLLPGYVERARSVLASRTATLVGQGASAMPIETAVKAWYDGRSAIAHGRAPKFERPIVQEVSELELVVRAGLRRALERCAPTAESLRTELDLPGLSG